MHNCIPHISIHTFVIKHAIQTKIFFCVLLWFHTGLFYPHPSHLFHCQRAVPSYDQPDSSKATLSLCVLKPHKIVIYNYIKMAKTVGIFCGLYCYVFLKRTWSILTIRYWLMSHGTFLRSKLQDRIAMRCIADSNRIGMGLSVVYT